MSKPSYTKTITVSASANDVYRALTEGFEHWWTKPSKTFSKVGDQAKFSFPPGISYWTFEATQLEPTSIEMKCVDALHIHEGKPKAIEQEWLNTLLQWQIEAGDNQTIIHFQHRGLTGDLLCYDICRQGWDYFFVSSLKDYLDTGKGSPHKAE